MRYLTKIFLTPEIMWRERIHDSYSLHRLVYSFFPLGKENNSRFLYADKGPVRGGRSLLILSETEPEIPQTLSSSATIVSDNFFSFRNYWFEIDMNPVRRDKKDGKRKAVTGQLELLKWFIEHTEKWGFEADQTTLEVQVRSTRQFPKNGKRCTFNHAFFRGRLQVKDPELFRKSFEAGLGHGKAFGFGLLQLRPAAPAANTK